MTYEETLSAIHDFRKFGSKLGLSRMTRLMELLGNPQDEMQVIHVAGTNGKGSVCRYIYSILKEQGYRVGLYTSPFLEVFNERIEFDGALISDADLIRCTEEVLNAVRRMVDAGEESPTEFEVITAAAFVYFRSKPIDFLILEVGLGGTGDSTNVVQKPLISVITSISYDHMEYLGDTLEKITAEKAGIFKADCPVVYSIKDPDAAVKAREIAESKGCFFWDVLGTAGRACVSEPKNLRSELLGCGFDAAVLGIDYTDLKLSMTGLHQVENACCALTVIEVLKKGNKIKIDDYSIYKGLREAKQIGRFEILQEEPYVIIDGAHNDDGARALAEAVKLYFRGKRTLFICGILADKEVDKMIGVFGSLGADMAATEPDCPRSLPSAELCRRIEEAGYPCVDVGNYKQAVEYGKGKRNQYDVIIYAGSLYLIGKVREGFQIEH